MVEVQSLLPVWRHSRPSRTYWWYTKRLFSTLLSSPLLEELLCCSSGRRSDMAFPNQVPQQCAHTHPPPPPGYGVLQAIKPGKLGNCLHVFSQTYVLYSSCIGQKQIYIAWKVVLFFSRFLSRQGGEQVHPCEFAQGLAAGDALVLLRQVRCLPHCTSVPSS